MDEHRINEMAGRIRRKDKRRNYDEAYWLDMLEVLLARVVPHDLDEIAELQAEHLIRHPSRWKVYIAASRTDTLAWKTLRSLLGKLRARQPGSFVVSAEHHAEWEAALQRLNGWALDVAQGIRSAPRRKGRDRRSEQLRNASIVATVNGIRNLGTKPATSSKADSSACHVVAKRVNLSYEAVRTIWRNNQRLLKQASELGIIPPLKMGKRTANSL